MKLNDVKKTSGETEINVSAFSFTFYHSFQTFLANIKLYAYLNLKKHWYLFPITLELHENFPAKGQIQHILYNSKDNLNNSFKYKRVNAGPIAATFLHSIELKTRRGHSKYLQVSHALSSMINICEDFALHDNIRLNLH